VRLLPYGSPFAPSSDLSRTLRWVTALAGTGALTTDADKTGPQAGSAWNITGVVRDPQLNDWSVTNPAGTPVDAPLDLTSNVAWVGYANEALRRSAEPVLQRVLRRRGLLK